MLRFIQRLINLPDFNKDRERNILDFVTTSIKYMYRTSGPCYKGLRHNGFN